MAETLIERIEWAPLEGRRPRFAGGNAFCTSHGWTTQVPVARVVTSDGASGFGWSQVDKKSAESMVGHPLKEAFQKAKGSSAAFAALDLPLWDLAGNRSNRSVYELLSGQASANDVSVPCYDTTILMEDLQIKDDGEATALIVSEALEGLGKGHRAFKIKVGRGAMHMPVDEGLRRDVRIVNAIRSAVGQEIKLMIDVNNGYNLNLAMQLLAETAESNIYWIEEPFHESQLWSRYLKEWLQEKGLSVKLADGEGDASILLLNMAEKGLIDIIQYDLKQYGFSQWLALSSKLDDWGVGTAPHNYGGMYGNYATCHLAGAVKGFEMVEWDEAVVEGLSVSGYSISDGLVQVPSTPGFGLELDLKFFQNMASKDGFCV